MPEMTILDTFF